MKFTFALIICLFISASIPISAQNPFMSGSDSSDSASVQKTEPAEPPFWYPIVVWQKAINAKLTDMLGALSEKFSLFHVLAVFFISLFYSLLHTGGPGHGKLILGTYFLTSEGKRKKSDAAIAGIIVSLTHIGMAFILSLILFLVLQTLNMSSQRDLAGFSRRIGGIFVVITGLAVFLTTLFRNKISLFQSAKSQEKMKNLSLYGIAVLSGIVPCPLAWFVLIFSMSYGIYIYGIISIVGMAIGAAITVGTTGFLILLGKEKAMNLLGSGLAEKIAFGLRYCGGIFLVVLGAIMVAP